MIIRARWGAVAAAALTVPLLYPPAQHALAGAAHGCEPRVIDMGTLGGSSSEILEVNSRRQWVGTSRKPNEVHKAVIWGRHGIRDLGTIGEAEGDDINNRGVVVGNHKLTQDSGAAFIWRHGVLRDLPELPGGQGTFVRRLNERGDAAGAAVDRHGVEHAVVWRRGRHLVKLPIPGGFLGAYAMGINDRGDVVGGVYNENQLIAWGWDRRGGNHVLARIDLDGFSQPNVLDNRGRAAGISDFGGNPGGQAALWHNGHERSLGVFGDSDYSFALGTNGQGDFVGVGSYYPGEESAHVFLTSASWEGPLRTLMPLSGDPADDSGAHAATGGRVSVGGHSETASGEKHATVWTCAYRQAFVPDVQPPATAGQTDQLAPGMHTRWEDLRSRGATTLGGLD